MKTKHVKNSVLTAALAVSCIWVTGCASIITSGDRTIPVRSQPVAATVIVCDSENNVVANSITPTKIKLKKGAGDFEGADYRMVISKDGYQPKEIEIQHNINGWYFGNLFIGGLLGMVMVDPLTGGMWVLKADKIDVELAPTVGLNEPALPVLTLGEITQAQRERLEPLNSILSPGRDR